MMNENTASDLLQRYEDMIHNGSQYYFDAEDIEDIAYQYEMAEEYIDALQAIDYGLRLHPDTPELLVRRAGYLLCLDRVEEAEQQIACVGNTSIDALLINAEIAFIKDNKSLALNCISLLLKDEDLSFEICLDVIDLYLDYSCIDEAIQFIHDAVLKLPAKREDLLREMAKIYEEQHSFDKAIDIYNNLLDNNPYSHDDWFEIARIKASQGLYDEAIDACDFALAIDESHLDTMIFRGCCLYDKGEYNEAMKVFDEVLDISADKGLAHAMLSACYSHMKLYDKAIVSLCTALNLVDFPIKADLYFQLATNYYNIGDIQHTREALEKAIDIDAAHIDSLNFLGEIYAHIGEYEHAVQLYTRVLELDADNILANRCMARLMECIALTDNGIMRKKYLNKAFEYWERIVDLADEDDIEPLLSLALAHFNYGDVDIALSLADEVENRVHNLGKSENMSDEYRIKIDSLYQVMTHLRDKLRKDLNTEL